MLRFVRAIMPKEDRFFDMFERHAQILVAGADAMARMLAGEENIPESCKQIAAHENAADDVTRDVLVAVRRSFITPFDRSAITALTSAMDDALDEMWQTAKAITLYEVASFEPQMVRDEPARGRSGAPRARRRAAASQYRPQCGPAARDHRGDRPPRRPRRRAPRRRPQGALPGPWREQCRWPSSSAARSISHIERVLDRLEDVADEIQGIVIDHA